MIVIDEPMLDLFRGPGRCEGCGKPCRRREPHHIKKRGLGGGSRLDIPINLIALGSAFDCACHIKAEAGTLPKAKLLEIVAGREGRTPEQVELEIYRLLRTRRGLEVRRDG